MGMELANKINRATDYLRARLGNRKPTVGLILGSGLGIIADSIENPLSSKVVFIITRAIVWIRLGFR